MSDHEQIPHLNNRIICIVDRDARELAAIISSYLFEAGTYTPVFLFGRAKTPRSEDPAFMSESYLAYLMVEDTSVLIHNSLVKMGGCEYVILAGLNEEQKTYLHFSESQKIVNVTQASEVQSKLGSLIPPKSGEFRCKSSQILKGLYLAQKQGKSLAIDENAQLLPIDFTEPSDGLVLVEDVDDVAPVIAINYANAIDASVLVVEPLEKNEGRDIQRSIQQWKEKSDHVEYDKIVQAAARRLGSCPILEFRYATFFTEGLPYSLVLENPIPCSCVHLSIRPDLFIINNILLSENDRFGSAVVFSPVFFDDEETDWLCEFFEQSRYLMQPLIGKGSTVANLDFYAQYWPYDILHICSHGGEVDGYEMSDTFFDQQGVSHIVEFEEVVGYTPVPDNPNRIMVHRKVFPRTLDGYVWMSSELRDKNFDVEIINEMWKCMLECAGRRNKIGIIPMSCAIACSDSIHQGQFVTLASYSSPIIFNNSCWSWHEVALFFLDCGAKGYIGTLWAVENRAAVVAAKVFYENLFLETTLTAFHKALKAIDATPSRNIYIFWGLHFGTLTKGVAADASRIKIKAKLARSVMAWTRKIKTTKSAEIRRNSIRTLKSILREILFNFPTPDMQRLIQQTNRVLPELSKPDFSREISEATSPSTNVSSRECPVEQKNNPRAWREK